MSYSDESRHRQLITQLNSIERAIADNSSSREKIWVEFACLFLKLKRGDYVHNNPWFDASANDADEMLKRFDMRFRLPSEDDIIEGI